MQAGFCVSFVCGRAIWNISCLPALAARSAAVLRKTSGGPSFSRLCSKGGKLTAMRSGKGPFGMINQLFLAQLASGSLSRSYRAAAHAWAGELCPAVSIPLPCAPFWASGATAAAGGPGNRAVLLALLLQRLVLVFLARLRLSHRESQPWSRATCSCCCSKARWPSKRSQAVRYFIRSLFH